MRKSLFGLLTIGLVCVIAGCQGTPPGDLDNLKDENENGFNDLPAPLGVPFEEESNLKIKVINEVSRDDISQFASQFGIDASLVNLVDIIATVTVTLNYPDGVTDTVTETQSIAPFERSVELACPESVNVAIDLDLSLPFGQSQSLISDDSIVLYEGWDYDCGATRIVRLFVGENGIPQLALQE